MENEQSGDGIQKNLREVRENIESINQNVAWLRGFLVGAAVGGLVAGTIVWTVII